MDWSFLILINIYHDRLILTHTDHFRTPQVEANTYPLISEMTSELGSIGGATIKFERPPRIVPLYLPSPASSEESSEEEDEDEKKGEDGFLTNEVNEERLIALRDDEDKADHVLTQLDEDEDDKEKDPDYVLTQLGEGEEEVVACTPVISNVKQKKGRSSKKIRQSSKKKGTKRRKQGYVLLIF